MNVTSRPLIMQRWNQVQMELLPELSAEVGVMTPKLEKLIHILDWVRIEEPSRGRIAPLLDAKLHRKLRQQE